MNEGLFSFTTKTETFWSTTIVHEPVHVFGGDLEAMFISQDPEIASVLCPVINERYRQNKSVVETIQYFQSSQSSESEALRHPQDQIDMDFVVFLVRQVNEGELKFVFHDPRWISDEMLYSRDESTQLHVEPRPGSLLIIPGYLWHNIDVLNASSPFEVIYAGLKLGV